MKEVNQVSNHAYLLLALPSSTALRLPGNNLTLTWPVISASWYIQALKNFGEHTDPEVLNDNCFYRRLIMGLGAEIS